MLMDIKSYLVTRGPATLSEIAARLAADPEAIRPMLEYWIRKKRIRRAGSAARCHGCTSCPPADLEFYEWTPAPTKVLDLER